MSRRLDLGELIEAENPYPGGLFIPEGSPVERYGIGAPFDHSVPFQVSELDSHDPDYWRGVFLALGGDARTTTTHRLSKVLRITYQCAGVERAIVIGFEGGGGGM